MTDVPPDLVAIDVGRLLQRTVTSLYAHLVTRPTGRAVRMAIEAQLQVAGSRSLSLIDLTEVEILDFSCADEVVAKLFEDARANPAHEAFFVLRGVREPHRDQIQVVLERRGLAAVAETSSATFELLGASDEAERRAWGLVEERGLVSDGELSALLPGGEERAALERIVERRLAFRSPTSGRVHALSRLVERLM